ncbi:RNA polymerase sigma-70 factor [Chitinophaga nivalis]|uniref:RNA polymerase sigma-70 factor n=1 Tax=Chitinophaga nivalis TaxID=2991709 RepID=A0ABT3ILE6_9BACT|nr:RNA polymerase sigma-70 factor [Chitinophaga nivalis]MCW3465521.1 RNA polymerase sigma-70 factor [Chitinophaga nivalis]MCW3484788.1 RNA polymerase sigma-70 factor [Chitinophaga nivalis]
MTNTPSYQAYKALFHAQYNDLCNYAFSFLGNDAAAEDVVQETFIKLWQKHQELISIPNIRSYLFRAVRNNSISVLRKQQVEEAGNKAFEWLADVSEDPDEQERENAKPYYDQLIYEAIANLPPQCREVFTCCRLQGMTHQQAATKLGLSAKTVENYMGRALKLLRKYLQQYGLPAGILFLLKLSMSL